MVKLPPVVKQLLSQRNPQPFASPPLHALNGVLQRTRKEAQEKGAVNGWLVLSVSPNVRWAMKSSGTIDALSTFDSNINACARTGDKCASLLRLLRLGNLVVPPYNCLDLHALDGKHAWSGWRPLPVRDAGCVWSPPSPLGRSGENEGGGA